MAKGESPLSFYMYHAVARKFGWLIADEILHAAVKMAKTEIEEDVVKYMTNLTHEVIKVKPIGEC